MTWGGEIRNFGEKEQKAVVLPKYKKAFVKSYKYIGARNPARRHGRHVRGRRTRGSSMAASIRLAWESAWGAGPDFVGAG